MNLIDELLLKTSRTFALTIPRLPAPTRTQVGVAYLLFRIADTFEDAAHWGRAQRVAALERFGHLLRNPDRARAQRSAAEWTADIPIRHRGYVELLEQVPAVLDAYLQLPEPARHIIEEHTVRTAEGMADYVLRTDDDGVLRLGDVDDLQSYCYVVAGIVGEMLTELFLLRRRRLQPIAARLRGNAASFGEGLQLVNILKDSSFDRGEGRRYLPVGIDRPGIFQLARQDLEVATGYTLSLQSIAAPRGLISFCALPVQLALATLDRVEQEGPGAKLTRTEVFEIVQRVDRALDDDRPAVAC